MNTPTGPTDGTPMTMSTMASRQFSYHVRMAAVLALSGETVESASESVLAWALLANQWPEATSAAADVASELIARNVDGPSEPVRTAALARARGLALDIEAHYVTVGLSSEATLYAGVADTIAEAVEALSSP